MLEAASREEPGQEDAPAHSWLLFPPLLAMTPLCPHFQPHISPEQGLSPPKKLCEPPPSCHTAG